MSPNEQSSGNPGRALAEVAAGLALAPDDPALLFARGSILFDWGRFHEALDAYLRAERNGHHGPALELQLGRSYLRVGRVADAEPRLRKSIALDSGVAIAHRELGTALRAQDQLDSAASQFEQALAVDPNDYDAMIELGNCKVVRSEYGAAESLFQRVIAIDGKRAVGWQNLGVAQRRQGRFDAALESIRRATALDEEEEGGLDSFVNLAIELADKGEPGEAMALFDRMLPRRPNPYGHYAYALLLLAAGRMQEGWEHFEFRWLVEPMMSARLRSAKPPWLGQDLHGKSIRLRIEQGLGDVIQFVRYAPQLKTLGATVQLLKFDPVAEAFPGIDNLILPNGPDVDFDYYVNLMSLPRIFGTDLGSIPGAPYLAAAPEQLIQWAPRLVAGHKLKVGLVWAGNRSHVRDRYRSVPLETLAPLGEVSGVQWFALQKGGRDDENAVAPRGFDWVSLGGELGDLRDTAAVIAQLDLLICVDTAVAHLAGALGKPVWLLVDSSPDWRWLRSGEETPWYPTMRIFRQKKRGDWDEVVRRVTDALRDRQERGRGATSPAPLLRETQSPPPKLPTTFSEWVLRGGRGDLSAITQTRAGILQFFPAEPDVGASIAWYGEWQQLQSDFLRRFLATGSTVLEMGAGVGANALEISSAIGPQGHLLLTEARPLQLRILRQNLAANRIANATVLKGAFRPAGAPLGMETIDDLQLERLDVLKLDDHSLAVLDGAAATIWRTRPTLLIAAPDEAALRALADSGKSYGCRCWRVETALFNPGNFNRRDDDIFAGRSALSLLAIPEEAGEDVALDGCVEL